MIHNSLIDTFSVLLCQNIRFIQKLAPDELGRLGINLSHIVCMRIIDTNTGGVTARVLCETTGYDKALISRMLSTLDKLGYTERNPHDVNMRRGCRYVLTERGSQLIERMNDFFGDLSQTLVSGVDEKELKSFYRTAALFTDKLRELSERAN